MHQHQHYLDQIVDQKVELIKIYQNQGKRKQLQAVNQVHQEMLTIYDISFYFIYHNY